MSVACEAAENLTFLLSLLVISLSTFPFSPSILRRPFSDTFCMRDPQIVLEEHHTQVPKSKEASQPCFSTISCHCCKDASCFFSNSFFTWGSYTLPVHLSPPKMREVSMGKRFMNSSRDLYPRAVSGKVVHVADWTVFDKKGLLSLKRQQSELQATSECMELTLAASMHRKG